LLPCGVLGEDFQGDVPVKLFITGQIHLSHAAGTHRLDDSVVVQHAPDECFFPDLPPPGFTGW
jgi:hypothetical protein